MGIHNFHGKLDQSLHLSSYPLPQRRTLGSIATVEFKAFWYLLPRENSWEATERPKGPPKNHASQLSSYPPPTGELRIRGKTLPSGYIPAYFNCQIRGDIVIDPGNVQTFEDFLRHHGYQPTRGLVIGVINRFPAREKGASNRSGWCMPFPDGGGVLGDYTTGVNLHWSPKKKSNREALHVSQYPAHDGKKEDHSLRMDRIDSSKTLAKDYWSRTKELSAFHPYLKRKGLSIHFSQQSFTARADEHFIVIPLVDFNGELQAIQRIGGTEKNNKRNLRGCVTKKTCGTVGKKRTQAVCICEGWATAISIHLSTGCKVFFGAALQNLLPITQMIKQRWPGHTIIVCADNDELTHGNPGLTVAKKTANQCAVHLAIPALPGDFDDMRQAHGMSQVRKLILGDLPANTGVIQ
jgi:putative DNA primase/helicase